MSRRVFVLAVLSLFAVLACPVLMREGGQAMGDEKAGREIRAAAISFVPTKFDLKGNSDRLEQMYRQAAAGGPRSRWLRRAFSRATWSTRSSPARRPPRR